MFDSETASLENTNSFNVVVVTFTGIIDLFINYILVGNLGFRQSDLDIFILFIIFRSGLIFVLISILFLIFN